MHLTHILRLVGNTERDLTLGVGTVLCLVSYLLCLTNGYSWQDLGVTTPLTALRLDLEVEWSEEFPTARILKLERDGTLLIAVERSLSTTLYHLKLSEGVC